MTRFRCIKTSLAIVMLASLCGCGGGGGSATVDTYCASDSSTGTTSSVSTGTGTTAGVFCSYATQMKISSYSVLNAGTCAIVTWSCSSTTRSVSANGLPDYTLSRTVNGVSVTDSASNIAFPNSDNPNTIAAQSVSQSVTLTPTQTSAVTATNSGTQKLGMALNGIVLDPSTAGTCTNAGACNLGGGNGAWNIEALGQSSFKFGVDNSNAHVQPQGTYHYHGIPEQLVTKLKALNTNTAMTLIGWAVDGFPIYARYGYADPLDTSSAIKTIASSFQLQTTADAGRPSTSTYPLGAFTQDYEYVAGSGDLDACNGRYGKTPEFPNGIYHYYATDTFPYLQRCVYGKLN